MPDKVEARAEWEVARERVLAAYPDALDGISGGGGWYVWSPSLTSPEKWLSKGCKTKAEAWLSAARTLPFAGVREGARALEFRYEQIGREVEQIHASRFIDDSLMRAVIGPTPQPTASEGPSADIEGLPTCARCGNEFGLETKYCDACAHIRVAELESLASPPSSSPLVEMPKRPHHYDTDSYSAFATSCEGCDVDAYADAMEARLRTLSAQLQAVTAERDEARAIITDPRTVREGAKAVFSMAAMSEVANEAAELRQRAEAAEAALAALRAEKGDEQ